MVLHGRISELVSLDPFLRYKTASVTSASSLCCGHMCVVYLSLRKMFEGGKRVSFHLGFFCESYVHTVLLTGQPFYHHGFRLKTKAAGRALQSIFVFGCDAMMLCCRWSHRQTPSVVCMKAKAWDGSLGSHEINDRAAAEKHSMHGRTAIDSVAKASKAHKVKGGNVEALRKGRSTLFHLLHIMIGAGTRTKQSASCYRVGKNADYASSIFLDTVHTLCKNQKPPIAAIILN